MDDLSQFRSQIIQATLKPSKVVESHEGVSHVGVDPNVDGSELATTVKKSGNLLEQVLEVKGQQAGDDKVLSEKRQEAIKQTNFGMMEGIMRAMR